jgi:hypothetical protein
MAADETSGISETHQFGICVFLPVVYDTDL